MSMGFDFLVHADWSVSQRKRWSVSASKTGKRWHIEVPTPAPTADALLELADSHCVLAGFDFPIGAPIGWGCRTGLSGFKEGLEVFGAGRWAKFCNVAGTAAEISLERPFYPRMSRKGVKQADLTKALCAADFDALRRACERATLARRAACPLFWTLGGNQVGKAALSGWREVVGPCVRAGARLWPFDGPIRYLGVSPSLTLAETYPAEAYGHVGMSFGQVESKRRQSDRLSKDPVIRDWADRRDVIFSSALQADLGSGFGGQSDGEDKFDAFIGLCGMIEVVEGRRPEGAPETTAVRTWEGWILGQLS